MVKPFELPIEKEIAGLIEPSLQNLGYDIARLKISDGAKSQIVQIMIERVDGSEVIVEDCEKASRQISSILDVEDPIADEYNLEVSSPGIDRPLTRKKDFEKYIGFAVKVATKLAVDGFENRKKFKGELENINNDDESITIIMDDTKESATIMLDNITSAKLVLDDKLLDFHSNNVTNTNTEN